MREDLSDAAARWRATRAPADLVRAAAAIPAGSDRARVRELLGEPLVVSRLADGGESWLYVRADERAGRRESLSVAFDASGRYGALERKPLD